MYKLYKYLEYIISAYFTDNKEIQSQVRTFYAGGNMYQEYLYLNLFYK